MTAFLPTGYRLAFQDRPGEYVITNVIGRGASTIAYAAEYHDGTGSHSNRIIKEYCPLNITVIRDSDGALVCKESDLDRFKRGMENFVVGGKYQNELRNKVRLQNEIPFLSGCYSANNTVYLEVAPFYGKTLENIQDLTLLQRMQICLAVAKLIGQYHAAGYLCLDIKPANIFILKNSSDEIVTDLIEYIDFDSIRQKESVSFGNPLSFTEEWAAPEQKTPYGYKKVCEATDVYAVGELVFWLLFNRHSLPRERRDSSRYPYEECTADNTTLQRVKVRKLIQTILHNSIRSSISNRFSSMNSMSDLLKELVEELTKKQGLLSSIVQTQQCFYGRKEELAEIDAKLAVNNVVFLTGIPGIGKSELARQYILLHEQQYDNVLLWTYDGDLDSMVAWENTVRITNFTRLNDENDAQYAKRKLDFLGESLKDKKNLIFIDNIDKPIEELKGQDTLHHLFSLPGKKIVCSRATETLYPYVQVDPLRGLDELIELFGEYCPFRIEEKNAVSEIIDIVGRHTLLIELMAHYSVHRGPEKTLQNLREQGITGLQDEEIRLLKDNSVSSKSVSAHIEKLFAMDCMTEEQQLTLAKLALLPTAGVQTRQFASLFAINNFSDINWLIHHGWMTCVNSKHETLQIHPTIATVIMDHLKSHSALLAQLYVDCYNAVRVHRPNEMEMSDKVLYAESIALATVERYHITTRQAGIFLQQYVSLYSVYGNAEAKLRYIEYSIGLLEKTAPHGQYSALLEHSYRQKVSALVRLSRFDEAASIALIHLSIAKKAKDLYTTAEWYYFLSYIYSTYHTDSSEWLTIKYYLIGAFYAMKLEADASRKSPRFFNTEHLVNQLGYDYIEKSKYKYLGNLYQGFANWMENQEASELFCMKGDKSSIGTLKRACNIRSRVNSNPNTKNTYNSFEITIDKARIAFLEYRYNDAEQLLKEIVAYADEHHMLPTSTLYRVHQFLAHIALRRIPDDRETAIAEFERCLNIADEMESHNTYSVRLELGFQYLMSGEFAKAKPLVMDLWQETRPLAHEVRKTYRADALRNMSLLHLIEGKGYTANNMLKLAEEEYSKAEAPSALRTFGRARAYLIKAEIILRHGKGEAEELKQLATQWLELAEQFFEETVGANHPEAIACQERLAKLKNGI